jgi:hypothetical protein
MPVCATTLFFLGERSERRARRSFSALACEAKLVSFSQEKMKYFGQVPMRAWQLFRISRTAAIPARLPASSPAPPVFLTGSRSNFYLVFRLAALGHFCRAPTGLGRRLQDLLDTMRRNSAAYKRDEKGSDDEEDNKGENGGEGERVPTLLERRRMSTQPAAIDVQAASSSVVVGSEASPGGGATPTSATPLTNRRASLVPSTPTKADSLTTPTKTKLEARRSSAILSQIGGGSSETPPSIARRSSGMFATGTGAPPPVRHPFRASVRIDSPVGAKFPPDINKFAPPSSSSSSSARDPLLAMSASDVRRPSFAQTVAATGESLLKGQQPRRKLRKAATRILLLAALLFLLAKFLGRRFDLITNLDDLDDRGSHIQFPPSFTSLINHEKDLASPPSSQPSLAPKPARGGPKTSEESVLEGDELRRFREDHLWGPPSDKVETEVVKPVEGYEHEATIIFVHVRSLLSVLNV